MKQISLLIAGVLIFSACSSNAHSSENLEKSAPQTSQNGTVKVGKTIHSEEAKNLLATQKEVVILDVRTPEEYAGGHLKNAILLNKQDAAFEAKLKTLDRTKTYLVYCAAGGRSGQASRMMQQFGFAKIYDATDGFETLKNAGLAIEK